MIFKVSKKLKGSCSLPTLKKVIWANMTVSISGNDLRADDIKDVVRKGILIPVDEKYNIEEMEKDHDVIIVNNTDKVLILGKIILRPNGSLPISKDDANMLIVVSAGEDNLITILSDEIDLDEKKSYVKQKKSKSIKIKKKKVEEFQGEEESDYVIPETGEDKEIIAKAWDFKTKKMEEAQKVPKAEESVNVDVDEEREEVEFVDEKRKTKKVKTVSKKREEKKKITKKKVSVKKKKEITTKKKKVKTLEPVGEKKLPKTEADAALELDSRGNPLSEKPGDTLRHLIDSISSGEDVNFTDDEQSLDRYEKRTDME